MKTYQKTILSVLLASSGCLLLAQTTPAKQSAPSNGASTKPAKVKVVPAQPVTKPSATTVKNPPPPKAPSKPTSPVPSVKAENAELKLAKELYDNQDGKKSFQIFQRYAAQGDVEALAWLGRCYMNGIGTEKDGGKAFECFSKAAQKNNPWGINGLADCFYHGIGTQVNLQHALALYQKAAEMDLPVANLNLAKNYADKNGGCYDEKAAEKYFKKAVELDPAFAMPSYADFLCQRKQYQVAIPLLLKSTDNMLSRHWLAECYLNGYCIPVDISKAVDLIMNFPSSKEEESWGAEVCLGVAREEYAKNGKYTDDAEKCLRFAAVHENSEAQYYYALVLEKDDSEEAFSMMRKAADADYSKAILEIGKKFAEAKNYPEAIKYLTLATLHKKTEPEAVARLSNLYHIDMKEAKAAYSWDVKGCALDLDVCRNEIALREWQKKNDDVHFARAAALFAEGKYNKNKYASNWLGKILSNEYDRLRNLADHNNTDALFALGIVGICEEKGHPNVAVGLELLERAVKLNHPMSCRYLGIIYFEGVVVSRDIKKAAEYFKKGAEAGDAYSSRELVLLYVNNENFSDIETKDLQKAFDMAMDLEVYEIAYEYGLFMENMKNKVKALEYYRLASDHGDTQAMVRLFFLLRDEDIIAALGYLFKAIGLHDTEAELLIGDVYVDDNPRKAFVSFLNAYLDGDSNEASFRLAVCSLIGIGCERDSKCFWSFSSKAYENGNAKICKVLGDVYRKGEICAKDLNRARSYYEEGIKRKDEDCQKALADLEKNGK